MTDDIRHYTFSFEKEVGELRHSLGIKLARTLFVDVHVSGAGKAGLKHVIGDEQLKKNYLLKVRDAISSNYSSNAGGGSYSNRIQSLFHGSCSFVSLRDKEPFTEALGEENKELLRLFALYHETGHNLIPDGPIVDSFHPLQECAADAYAALRFLQRFGQEAAPLLSMISWSRSWDAVYGDTSHLTTTVLDKIIAASAHNDFSKLTPDETIELARTYARDWTPDAMVLFKAKPLLKQDSFSLLAKTGLTSSDEFTFYIAAKFFQPFLQPEGIVSNGKTLQFSEQDRQEYAALIKARLATLSLSRNFNAVANLKKEPESAVVELLKVSRPAGQKQFVYKA